VAKIRKLGIKFKLGQLIPRKIIKIVATRCHILRLKCTKFDFGSGSAPDPVGGAHSTPPDALTGFEGVLFLKEEKEMGRKGREGGRGREARKGRKGKVASWLLGNGLPCNLVCYRWLRKTKKGKRGL